MVSGGMLAEDLGALCGWEHVGYEGEAICVAPRSTAEVSSVLRLANDRGMPVNATGGGTKQTWCGRDRASIVLKTHRMSRVLEHPWQDMTCTVEAGCTWNAMQKELARHGQFVALDPVFADRASVGGVCGANDSGALRLKYGSLRDIVIGMTLMLADGTVAKTGGKVVKNVAGYDLYKLVTGAFGTLAIVTEVTFRLHSIAPNTATFSVKSAEVGPLSKLLLGIVDSHLSLESVQMRSAGAGYSLDIALSALPEVVTSQAALLGRLAEGAGLAVSPVERKVWSAREELFGSEGLCLKITMLPSEIAEMGGAVSRLGGQFVAQSVGVMIASVPQSGAGGLVALRERAERGGGSLVLLGEIEGLSMDRWGTVPDSLPVMREIKRRFDPRGILNPGRFIGGI